VVLIGNDGGGRAGVATRLAGIPELVHDEDHGLLVPPGVWISFANHSSLACRSRSSQQIEFAAAGREQIERSLIFVEFRAGYYHFDQRTGREKRRDPAVTDPRAIS